MPNSSLFVEKAKKQAEERSLEGKPDKVQRIPKIFRIKISRNIKMVSIFSLSNCNFRKRLNKMLRMQSHKKAK